MKPISEIAQNPTRFLFFTGKGGVGKTSLACAVALHLAESGRRTLLISTDPASNLDEVLGLELTRVASKVPNTDNLCALNIDPEQAAEAYREKVIGPMRALLPQAALRSMEEQLSGACTMEIAAFNEFTSYLGGDAGGDDFDHVIFDTAPTGHTLRLMSLSKAWTGFLDNNTSGASCLGPLAGLEKQREIYRGSMESLADAQRTTLILVARPERAALKEAERTSKELAALGIKNQKLALNGVFTAQDPHDLIASRMERRGEAAMKAYAAFLDSLTVYVSRLRPNNMVGLDALRQLLREEEAAFVQSEIDVPQLPGLSALVDRLQKSGKGVVMTMGKGGVGKTTVAAAIAWELARRGEKVHLSTTDPAAHIQDAIGGGSGGLIVRRIDPAEETRKYVEQVLASQPAEADAESRALLEEDLRSPCTEEIAVFRAFARTVAQGQNSFVVLDTAPTGHTLLLLDATESYHRELGRQSRAAAPEEVRQLLPRLRDPAYCHVILVTLPEATPVHEAASLKRDLERAGIHPCGWVINQSLAASGTTDPLLRQRAAGEDPFIREVAEIHSPFTVLLPWTAEEPVGPEGLSQFFNETSNLTNHQGT
jgi:arsenite-transporting ATPase